MSKNLKVNNIEISKETLGRVVPSLEQSSSKLIENLIVATLTKQLKEGTRTLKELSYFKYVTVDSSRYVLLHNVEPKFYSEKKGLWESFGQELLKRSVLTPISVEDCLFHLDSLLAQLEVA